MSGCMCIEAFFANSLAHLSEELIPNAVFHNLQHLHPTNSLRCVILNKDLHELPCGKELQHTAEG
jgi:hypothetical protein